MTNKKGNNYDRSNPGIKKLMLGDPVCKNENEW